MNVNVPSGLIKQELPLASRGGAQGAIIPPESQDNVTRRGPRPGLSWREIRPEYVLRFSHGFFDYAIILHGRNTLLTERAFLPAAFRLSKLGP
jgi:hypothetical protein